MDSNIKYRVKNAEYMGREARLNRCSIESNPFINYQGINGDGALICAAFERGWRQANMEVKPAGNET